MDYILMEPEYSDIIMSLVKEELYIPNMEKKYWDWKFNKKNVRYALGYIILIKKKVAGFASFMPYKVKVGDRIGTCFLVADVVMDRRYRGKGLFTPFYQWCLGQLETKTDFLGTYLFSSPMAYQVYTKRFGYRPVGRLDYFIARGSTEGLLKRKLGRAAGKLAETALSALWRRSTVHDVDAVLIRQIERFDSAFDDLWERVKGRWVSSIERNCDYLNWRYINHPWHRYTILAGYRGQTLVGYIILLGTNIMDLTFIDEETGQSLLKRAIEWFRDKGVVIVNCQMFGDKLEKTALKNSGFIHYPFNSRPLGLSPSPEILFRPSTELGDKAFPVKAGWKFTTGDIDCGN